MPKKPHYLFAILNWGLGHATRCIPIINHLLGQGVKVSLASDGRAKHLLEKEYPELNIYTLPSYSIKYSKNGSWLPIAHQMLSLPKVIRKENEHIQKIVKESKIDVIISDNRYGCYSSELPSVIITHQLFLKTPIRFPFINRVMDRIIAHYISKFDELWIPDVDTVPNLSGDLSHKHDFTSIPKFFIGSISRFERAEREDHYDAAVVLSGPEPQRSILEETIMYQAKALDKEIIIVRGISEGSCKIVQDGNISSTDFLSSESLNEIILRSKVVICRSGYTSIMDLVKLQKAAIFIPTPGQSEQEYLAELHKRQKSFYSVKQEEFNLAEALKKYSDYENQIEVNNEDDVLKERLFALSNIKTL